MDLEKLYAPIEQGLEVVEERLATVVTSEAYPVAELYHHILSSGGKKIRPALVRLSMSVILCRFHSERAFSGR